ncbi:tRNA methyltransferase, has a role in tRNA modification, partial [Coemansia sp. RSA 1933]
WAVAEILRVVRAGGTVLIFAWALEQNSRRKFDPNVQDVLVPWGLPGSKTRTSNDVDDVVDNTTHMEDKVFH